MAVCRNESGGSDVDGRAAYDPAVLAGRGEDRVAPAFRAQIILALADGLTNKEAAGRLATRPATVSKWRGRFARHGLAGVADAPRSGKPRHYDALDERRILGALDAPPPAGYARWNGPPAWQASGRYLQAPDLAGAAGARDLAGATAELVHQPDPAFAQKAADIVALYLQPPENAVVLSVDEKPHIQALERAQGLVEAAQRQSAHWLQP